MSFLFRIVRKIYVFTVLLEIPLFGKLPNHLSKTKFILKLILCINQSWYWKLHIFARLKCQSVIILRIPYFHWPHPIILRYLHVKNLLPTQRKPFFLKNVSDWIQHAASNSSNNLQVNFFWIQMQHLKAAIHTHFLFR